MKGSLPTFGSRWEHHSGRIYTVLGVANTENANPKYPITVVYVGENGNLWAKTLSNFLETMCEIQAILASLLKKGDKKQC